MKLPHLLLLLLAHPALAADPKQEDAAQIKAAIERDWTARGDSGGVEITSPSYPMPYGQGCVIHSLYFPNAGTGPAMGHMVTHERYFVFATGQACATADPAQFFHIEPGNETAELLEFAKQLKNGPRPGMDRGAADELAKISPCFTPEAMATTRIVRAHSWGQQGDGRHDRYQVRLRCKALEEQGEIVALGVRSQDAVSWKFAPWGQAAVDLPPEAAQKP